MGNPVLAGVFLQTLATQKPLQKEISDTMQEDRSADKMKDVQHYGHHLGNAECLHKHTQDRVPLSIWTRSVRPQDDFYNYVNGGWMKTTVIPADKASWGAFNELREKTDENSLKILKNILY